MTSVVNLGELGIMNLSELEIRGKMIFKLSVNN